jgi:uncharacterized ParB-like nuclease family protein
MISTCTSVGACAKIGGLKTVPALIEKSTAQNYFWKFSGYEPAQAVLYH